MENSLAETDEREAASREMLARERDEITRRETRTGRRDLDARRRFNRELREALRAGTFDETVGLKEREAGVERGSWRGEETSLRVGSEIKKGKVWHVEVKQGDAEPFGAVQKLDQEEEFQIQDLVRERLGSCEEPHAGVPEVFFRVDREYADRQFRVVMENLGVDRLKDATNPFALEGLALETPKIDGRPTVRVDRPDQTGERWECINCLQKTGAMRSRIAMPYVWKAKEGGGDAALCATCVAAVGDGDQLRGFGRFRFEKPVTVQLWELMTGVFGRSLRVDDEVEFRWDDDGNWYNASVIQVSPDRESLRLKDPNGRVVAMSGSEWIARKHVRRKHATDNVSLNGFAFWEIMRRVTNTLRHLNEDGFEFSHGDLHARNVLVRIDGVHRRVKRRGVCSAGGDVPCVDVRPEDITDVFVIDFGWSRVKNDKGRVVESKQCKLIRKNRIVPYEGAVPDTPGAHRDLLTLYLSMFNVPNNWIEVHELVGEFAEELRTRWVEEIMPFATRFGHKDRVTATNPLTFASGKTYRGRMGAFVKHPRRGFVPKFAFEGNVVVEGKAQSGGEYFLSPDVWKEVDFDTYSFGQWGRRPNAPYWIMYDDRVCPTVRSGRGRRVATVFEAEGPEIKTKEGRVVVGASQPRWRAVRGDGALAVEDTVMSKFVPALHDVDEYVEGLKNTLLDMIDRTDKFASPSRKPTVQPQPSAKRTRPSARRTLASLGPALAPAAKARAPNPKPQPPIVVETPEMSEKVRAKLYQLE